MEADRIGEWPVPTVAVVESIVAGVIGWTGSVGHRDRCGSETGCSSPDRGREDNRKYLSVTPAVRGRHNDIINASRDPAGGRMCRS